MRKEAGFDVTDHITLCIAGNDKLETLLRENETAVSGDVLADEIVYGTTDGYEKEGTSTARRRRWRWQRSKLPERQKAGPEGILFRGFFRFKKRKEQRGRMRRRLLPHT